MKTAAVTHNAKEPSWECKLYLDANGHWFAEVKHDGGMFWTSTYTTRREAVEEAMTRSTFPTTGR